MDPRCKHADDMANPITDACAKELAAYTPVSEIPFDVPFGTTWFTGTAEYRDFFRDRARRFLAGDLSMLPMKG